MSKKTIKTFFAPAEFMDLFKYSTGKLREHGQKIVSISLSANFTVPSLKTPIALPINTCTVASNTKNTMLIVAEQRQRVRQITVSFHGNTQSIEGFIKQIKKNPILLGMTWKVSRLILENADTRQITRWRNQRVNGHRSLMCYRVNEKTIDQLTYKQIMHAVGGFYEDACKVSMSENKFISWEHLPCKV